MSERSLIDPASGPVLGSSRGRVLEVLRSAGGPLGVQDIAERTDLHPNTARFHLDGLVEVGLVEREAEERGQPGRPRMVYRAVVTDLPAGRRSYRLLAEMFTSLIADTVPEPDKAAASAGEAWGRYLAERPPPSHRVDAAEALRRLTAVLADVGFAPGEVGGEFGTEANPVIPLRHCPFQEVAEQHREIVCALHLGMIRGVLAEVRAPLDAEGLEPFVGPSLCLARLTTGAHRRDSRHPGTPA
ncbi:MAG TPA: helix-turn-helix domain-containing protein [Amycolatopsis sp.]|jgi:predicted ArsR family transcriptional regulator|nr:helix-turn-helix domain-containing protein [Amycolatopsis sp.]